MAGPGTAERDARLAALLAAAARGDAAAFESFYDATVGLAQALAWRFVRGAELEDLLADAFFEAWRNAPRFDPSRGSAVTWLLTLVRSRALDRLRRAAARPETAMDDPPEPKDDSADPAETLWRREAGSRLDQALRALDARERWVLGLAFFRGLGPAEIATATGLAPGSVKSTLSRAQSKLRRALAG